MARKRKNIANLTSQAAGGSAAAAEALAAKVGEAQAKALVAEAKALEGLLDLDLEALASQVDGEAAAVAAEKAKEELSEASEGPLGAFRAAVLRLAALVALWRQGKAEIDRLNLQLEAVREDLPRLEAQAKKAAGLLAQKGARLEEAVRRLRVTGKAGLQRAKEAQVEALEAKAKAEAAQAALGEAKAKEEELARARHLLQGDLRALPAVAKLERGAREVARGQLETLVVRAGQAGVTNPDLAAWAAEEGAEKARLAALAATVAPKCEVEADEFRLVYGEGELLLPLGEVINT